MGELEWRLDPEALHNRLVKLWEIARRTHLESAKIHVDEYTCYLIFKSKRAYLDGSVKFDNSGHKLWRNIPAVLHSLLSPSLVHSPNKPTTPEEIGHLFCMYIEVKKRNGRVVYFDDPETNKKFL